MPRTVQAPTLDEYGAETHPAFGMIQVNRRSSHPGAVLFDSDIRHGHTVVVSVHTATRQRDLSRDWIHPRKELVEVEMSEAQWASFVSSMGTQGVPATLRVTEGEYMLPGLSYDPRLAHSMDEVKGAAEATFGQIEQAMAAYDALDSKATAKEKRLAIDKVRASVRNARSNVAYTARSLTEHAENVVQRSRADIEAMAVQAADRLGLPTGTRLMELDAAPDKEDA